MLTPQLPFNQNLGLIWWTIGVSYEWTFVSTDPDEDEITYYVDWGDECSSAEYYGPYPSGEEVSHHMHHHYCDLSLYYQIHN